MSIDTPRTDVHAATTNPIHYVKEDFARELERENTKYKEVLQKIANATRIDSNNKSFMSWAEMKVAAMNALK